MTTTRTYSTAAIAGAVAAIQVDADDRVSRCGVGLLGLGSTPLRGTTAEDALVGRTVGDLDRDAALELARSTMAAIEDIPADLQGSSTYRARVGATMLARALSEALAAASEKE